MQKVERIIILKSIVTRIFQTYYMSLYSCLLMILGIIVLGLPFSNMGLKGDDLVLVYSGKMNSLKDLIHIFTSDVTSWVETSHSKILAASILNVRYRPLLMVVLGLQYHFWGTSTYGYYLFNVFIHSFNAVLIFRIFSWMFSPQYAFLAALFFLFQCSVSKYLYMACAIQDWLYLMFSLLVIISYKNFLVKNSYKWQLLAAFWLLLGIFTREVIIVLPICIFLYLILFCITKFQLNWSFILFLIKKFYLLIISVLIFVITNIAIFGINIGYNNTLSKTRLFRNIWDISIKDRLWSLIDMLNDIFGLAFINTHNPRIRIIFILPVLLGLLYIFYYCKTKKVLLFIIISTLIMCWPSLLLYHDARYIYVGIPLVILFVFWGIKYTDLLLFSRFKVLFGTFFLLFLMINIISFIRNSRYMEKTSHISVMAIKQLGALLDDVNSKKLVFIGLPDIYSSGVETAIKMFTKHKDIKVILQCCNFLWRDGSYNIDIMVLDDGYRLITRNSDIAYWYSPANVCEGGVDLGDFHFFTNKKNGKYKATDISIIFKNKRTFIFKDTVFLSWDSKYNSFKIIPRISFYE